MSDRDGWVQPTIQGLQWKKLFEKYLMTLFLATIGWRATKKKKWWINFEEKNKSH